MPAELVKDATEGFVELEGREIDLSELDQAYDQGVQDSGDIMAQQQIGPGETL